jgi:hypothetical protein
MVLERFSQLSEYGIAQNARLLGQRQQDKSLCSPALGGTVLLQQVLWPAVVLYGLPAQEGITLIINDVPDVFRIALS